MTRQSAYDARRIASGWKRIPVWLDPETLVALDRLSGGIVSQQEAIRRAIKGAVAVGVMTPSEIVHRAFGRLAHGKSPSADALSDVQSLARETVDARPIFDLGRFNDVMTNKLNKHRLTDD